jgi:hypothetical protein
MQVADLTFEVRNASLQRVAILQPGDGLTTFKATVRFNNVGTWEITIPETSARADLLRTPGYGIIVTGPNGVLFSGPTTAATNQKTSGSPIGVWAIRGATDSIVLGEHLAYPTPSTADVTLQTAAYDASTAVASTLMYYYVKRNMVSAANGGSAPAARAVTGLTCATDTAIGSSIVGKARFDNLGTLMQSIAATSTTQLGFDIKQSGTGIQFSVYQPTDRTGTVRLDTANGTLQKAAYGYGYGPTRVVVAGQGQGTARAFVETSNTSAESNWSRRVERFVDQRNETDTTKLTQAGNDLLTQEGGNITSLDIVPTSDSTMTYGVDFNLGDKVSVIVGSQEVTGIVTTAQFSVKEDGLWVGLTVGNATGFDFDAVMMKKQTDTANRVSALEKSEALSGTIPVGAGGTGATTLTGYVYGNGTSTMTAATTIPASAVSGVLAAANIPAGSVLQTATSTLTSTPSIAVATFGATGLSVTLTPRNSSSKFLLFASVNTGNTGAAWNYFDFARGSTLIGAGVSATTQNVGAMVYMLDNSRMETVNLHYLDSPATGSAVTYNLYWSTYANTAYLNRRGADLAFKGLSSLTVLEIAG